MAEAGLSYGQQNVEEPGEAEAATQDQIAEGAEGELDNFTQSCEHNQRFLMRMLEETSEEMQGHFKAAVAALRDRGENAIQLDEVRVPCLRQLESVQGMLRKVDAGQLTQAGAIGLA